MRILPTARIEHRLPGRLRLRLPAMRGDHDFFSELEEAFAAHPALGAVTLSPATASILFEDIELGDRSFERLARKEEWFEVQWARPQRTDPGSTPNRPGANAMAALSEMRPSLAIILVALALVQAARGQLMVPALSLLWFAYVLIQDQQSSPTPVDEWPAADHSVH